MKYNWFPYSFDMSLKIRNKHAFSPGFMYEIKVLFRNRKSYFDLKPSFFWDVDLWHSLKIRQI